MNTLFTARSFSLFLLLINIFGNFYYSSAQVYTPSSYNTWSWTISTTYRLLMASLAADPDTCTSAVLTDVHLGSYSWNCSTALFNGRCRVWIGESQPPATPPSIHLVFAPPIQYGNWLNSIEANINSMSLVDWDPSDTSKGLVGDLAKQDFEAGWAGDYGSFLSSYVAANPDRLIWTTGHSTGSMLAALTLMRLFDLGARNSSLLYYVGHSVPRFVNAQLGARMFNSFQMSWEFAYQGDPAPQLPSNNCMRNQWPQSTMTDACFWHWAYYGQVTYFMPPSTRILTWGLNPEQPTVIDSGFNYGLGIKYYNFNSSNYDDGLCSK